MNDPNTTLSGHDLSNVDWAAAARRMRFLIETNHMTVPDVAHDLGIKQVTLQEILDGQARASEYLIVAAANYFGVSVDFLVSDQSHPNGAADPEVTGSLARTATARKKRSSATAGLTLSDLAVRHQALVELLVENGAFTATEYNAKVQKISERTKG